MTNVWWSPFEPVWPYGPPYINRPREWNFPVGYNVNYIPQRMNTLAMLRGMRSSWGVLATIIETRKDQLLRIPWTIQLRDKPRGKSAGVDQMRKFFRRPDLKNTYGQWSRKLLDDLFVIDAPTVYFSRDRRGRPLSAEVLDGATIFPLIDDAGRRPDSVVELDEDGLTYIRRQPAFQQIIYGLPMIDLDESELMYVPMRPRPDLPMFGFAPTEQIFIEASEAIRKTVYQLNFWAEGTLPDLVVTVPDNWSPRQIAMFQAHFDAMLAGNLKLKSHVRFLPGGMKPFDIKNSSGESLWSQRDETLIRLACYAYSVSPTPFVKAVNRGTATTAQQVAEEEGLYPLMSYWKDDIIDPIIQERFGLEDVEFVFLPRPEVDQEKQAKIHDMQLKSGSRTINEIREERGEEPITDGDTPLIYIGNAVIPLDDAVSGNALPGASAGGDQLAGGSDTSDDKPPRPSADRKPTPSPAGGRGARMIGPARPRNQSPQPKAPTPTPIHKAWSKDQLELLKASYKDVKDAAKEAKQPKDGQKEPGNYRKGHVWVQGLDISIETPKGDERFGHNPDGTKWSSTMAGHYGYIRGTVGADGDQIDVCIGRHPKSDTVFVIDQVKANTGRFDEHKVMLGYRKAKAALRDYLDSNGDRLGALRASAMVEMKMPEFKAWLARGNHFNPIAGQGYGTRVDGSAMAKWGKSDTISSSTNLAWYSQGLPQKKRRKKRRIKTQGPRWLELNA